MDGIGLELWNKKLILCRYKRQLDFKSCLASINSKGPFHTGHLPTDLYQAAVDNLEVLILYWKETYQGSWERQKPAVPGAAAQLAEAELFSLLSTEKGQIDNEISALMTSEGREVKLEEFQSGKALLDRKISVLRASCIAQITDLKNDRESKLEKDRERKKTGTQERWSNRWATGLMVMAGTLLGVWLGATLNARRSHDDRMFVDARMSRLMEGERKIFEALSVLHRSNRKIAFWTEKTPDQIDKEMDAARERLTAERQDIHQETLRKIARVESEYARSGRDGGAELDTRKNGLLKLEAKLVSEAEQKSNKLLDDLAEQKRNIQR